MEDNDWMDVFDVIEEETSRGRRPIDTEARREQQLLRRDYLRLIREGTEEDFLAAIRALGFEDGTPDFERIVALYREIPRQF